MDHVVEWAVLTGHFDVERVTCRLSVLSVLAQSGVPNSLAATAHCFQLEHSVERAQCAS